MMSRLGAFLAIGLLLCSLNSAASTVALSGQFRVNEQGAATYLLPIDAPASRGGLQPKVSISYSSAVGNGYLGVGMGLSANSAISRCPQTFSQDEQLIGVDLTATDRFCLDGQRLMLVSGNYGGAWSTYRKEVDDYSRITALGQAQGGGPLGFKVETKDGDLHYFGDESSFDYSASFQAAENSPFDHSAMFPAQGPDGEVGLNWGIKATVDPFGNYLSYQYYLNKSIGEHYLSSISYGGHTSASDSAPYRQIRFNYVQNPRAMAGYSAGNKFYMSKLLESIDVNVDGQVQYQYQFKYQASRVIEEKNYLLGIKKCTGISDGKNCSFEVRFAWTKPSDKENGYYTESAYDELSGKSINIGNSNDKFIPFLEQSKTSLPTSNAFTSQFFDMNGDGRGDMVYVSGSTWTMMDLKTKAKLSMSSIGADKKQYAQSINYDGDGQRDLLVANSEDSNWYVLSLKPSVQDYRVCEPNGGSTKLCEDASRQLDYEEVDLKRKAIGLEGSVVVADPNGDGLEDIVFLDGQKLNWYKNIGGTFAAAEVLYTFSSNSAPALDRTVTQSAANLKTTAALDINGDGRTDLLTRVSTTTTTCRVGSNIISSVGSRHECEVDWEGDWSQSVVKAWHLLVAKGDGYVNRGPVSGTNNASLIRVADANGDGLVDLFYVSDNKWYQKLSTGVEFGPSTDINESTTDVDQNATYFVDLNRDVVRIY